MVSDIPLRALRALLNVAHSSFKGSHRASQAAARCSIKPVATGADTGVLCNLSITPATLQQNRLAVHNKDVAKPLTKFLHVYTIYIHDRIGDAMGWFHSFTMFHHGLPLQNDVRQCPSRRTNIHRRFPCLACDSRGTLGLTTSAVIAPSASLTDPA